MCVDVQSASRESRYCSISISAGKSDDHKSGRESISAALSIIPICRSGAAR